MRQRHFVVYLNNAVDESIRAERAITTDSPAATNKVLSLARAMRVAGMRCIVLSLGRGRQNGTGVQHGATVRRMEHGAVLYAAFCHMPWLTHVVSVVSLAWLLARLIRNRPALRVLAYNRAYHYLPALLLARLCGKRVYLDLEDGYIFEGRGGMRRLKNGLTRRLFSWLCPDGSMVASSELAGQLDRPPTMVCHGVCFETEAPYQDWSSRRLQLLFSGTLMEEVGCTVLLAALEILRSRHPEFALGAHVVVTGKGPFSGAFRSFAEQAPEWLSFCGSMRRIDYLNVLKNSHIGVSLRMSAYEMGSTTFPSKVLEYAEHGLLVLTTKASDVPALFGKDALYLEEESPKSLAALLASLPGLRETLQKTAIRGRERVLRACAPEVVGRDFRRMLSQDFNEI
jgi:glycosyltransferase involved in cell wall biosynthesis